ncbi:MAG TPA: ABC transporter substrate-binding protein [Chloroflexota bacterium]|jgi:NitT/TauT family transport system substrate-binding protein
MRTPHTLHLSWCRQAVRLLAEHGQPAPWRGVLLAGALLCGACATPAAPTAPTAAPSPAAPPRQSITSGAGTATSFGTTFPRHVANYLGYFAEEGLDVQVVVTGGDSQTLAGMIAGDVQVAEAAGTDGLVLANAKGQEFYAVAGYLNSLSYSLMSAPGITSAAALRGGTVAIARPGDTTDRYARVALRHIGLEPERDVAMVSAQSSPERTRSLVAGLFQGALIGRSENAFVLSQGGTELVDLRDLYPDYANRVIGVSGPALADHADAVKRFVKGMLRAYRWLHEPGHQAEAEQIAAAVGLEVQFFDQVYDDLVRGVPRDGEISARGLQVVLDDLRATGQIPADFTVDRVVRTEPLRAAQAELGD